MYVPSLSQISVGGGSLLPAGRSLGGDWRRSILYIVAGCLFTFTFVSEAEAATLYWVGGNGDSVTGNANDWNTTDPASCNDGLGNASAVPGSADTAIFDADCDNGATITANWSLTKLQMNSGYTGTITQSAGTVTLDPGSSGDTFVQSDGTFTGALLDINDGNFNQSGGVFTNSGMTIEQNFTRTGGAFSGTGKTVTFNGTGDISTLTCTGTLSGTVDFQKISNGDTGSITIASGCTINLGASPSTSFGTGTNHGTFTNNGTITILSGTWTHTGGAKDIVNNGTITHSGTGWDINLGGINNAIGGTITYAGTAITMEYSFTQSGTFDLTGKTITFDGSGSKSSTITCTGSLGGTVGLNKAAVGDTSNFTVASGCTIDLGASPTTDMGSNNFGTFTNNGTITIPSGTWTHDMANAAFTNNGTITINGSSWVINGGSTLTNAGTITHNGTTWDINDASLTNNSGATITYSGTAITMERSFTQNGTFDLAGITITFDDTSAEDDTTLSCGTIAGSIILNKDVAGADTTLGSDCTVVGDDLLKLVHDDEEWPAILRGKLGSPHRCQLERRDE